MNQWQILREYELFNIVHSHDTYDTAYTLLLYYMLCTQQLQYYYIICCAPSDDSTIIYMLCTQINAPRGHDSNFWIFFQRRRASSELMPVPPIRPRMAVTIPVEEAPVPRQGRGRGRGRGGRTARTTRVLPQPRAADPPQEEAPEVESIEAAVPLTPPGNYAQLSIRLHVYHHHQSGGRTVIQNTTPSSQFVTPRY